MTDKQNPPQLLVVAHFVVWAVLVVVISAKILLPGLNAGPSFGLVAQGASAESEQEGIVILDFPYLLNFARETLLKRTAVNSNTSAYSLENHINVTRNWVDSTIRDSRYRTGRQFAMLFGYSPTMLCLLYPLAKFPNNVAFMLFNMVGLMAIWWMTHPVRCRYGVGLLSFISPLAMGCFFLGQTALVSGACLLIIAQITRNGDRSPSWLYPVLAGAALWVLTAKPPLALTAAAVLTGLRRWRPLVVAGVLTLFSTIIVSPYLGTGWINDYVQLLLSYDKVSAGPVLSWAIRPETMSNFRAILSVDVGLSDDLACRISGILWLVTAICLAATARLATNSTSKLWAMGILSYLLFCPHLTSTEELQLVLLIPLCVSASKYRMNRQELILLAILPLLPFLSPVGALFQGAHLALFAAKLLIVPLVVYTMTTANSNHLSRHEGPATALHF